MAKLNSFIETYALFTSVISNSPRSDGLNLLIISNTLVFAEGVPPSREVAAEYREIFRLKEDRLIFFPADLVRLAAKAGFVDRMRKMVLVPQVSVKNWLANSECTPEISRQIFDLHRKARPRFKEAYHMTELEDDCLIDMTFCIVRGVKPSVS